MSGTVLVLVGLVLCLAGARSVRLAVLAAGFGTGWLLADVFGASLLTGFVVALASAAAAFVLTLVMSKIVIFIAGCIVGTLIGAKLYVVLADTDSSWLLALVFVPSVALLSGFLAGRFQRRFMEWATALAGAALVLSGVAVLGGDNLDLFRHPDDGAESVLLAVAWGLLAILGRVVQHRTSGRGRERQPA